MGKEAKTNAMRILDKNKIPYEMNTYTCDEFIDGCHIADQLGQPYERSFKTLVTVVKSKNYFVFAIPVDKELNLKASAKAADGGTAAPDITGDGIDIFDMDQFNILLTGSLGSGL